MGWRRTGPVGPLGQGTMEKIFFFSKQWRKDAGAGGRSGPGDGAGVGHCEAERAQGVGPFRP